MASIFKNKIIKEKLQNFDVPNFEKKLEILNKWYAAYKDKSLFKKAESQCEQSFNQDFFIEILGYKKFPDTPYSIEPKGNTEISAQKADSVLGYFNKDDKKVSAVVEIKDVNTPLDKSQKRVGNLSPIQQAFKYKTQYKECKFVIATNFYEIRLLQDNQLDYEIFTLSNLANPKNDYFEFRKFYFLLNANNFTAKTGKSNTEELLSETRIEQEKITKEFYKEYKELRLNLMRSIYSKNPEYKNDISFVAAKAQKIIDRIMFVCFCEDANLLPENTLHKVIKSTENSFSSLWDTLKGFFNAIDKGNEKLGIPKGYNGGLFKEDIELNNLKISDEIIKNLAQLGVYDFKDDLSVNILGHIFEQSISDLEEIKQKVNKTEEKQSKRKKDGIFYTPDYIVDYIIKNSLGKYLEEKEQKILQKHKLKADIQDSNYIKRLKQAYKEYQQELQKVKVLDPACGSGAFLVKVFDFLLAENKRVGNIIDENSLFDTEANYKNILQNNIYGVDLNEESVEITKLSLWLKTAQKNKQLATLDDNIKCGNSLIDDKEVAGEKAFVWEKEFKDIMDNGGFDVVVGNPPYGANLDEDTKKYIRNKYKEVQFKIDTYSIFLLKSFSLLKKNGKCFFIIPSTLQDNYFEEKIREKLLTTSKIDKIIELDDSIFEDAVVHSMIFGFTNKKVSDYSVYVGLSKMLTEKLEVIPSSFFKSQTKYIFAIRQHKYAKFLAKLNYNSLNLVDVLDIRQAIKTGNDDIYY